MLEVRNIIYFTPFYFKSGNPPKNKYFVVLKRIGDKAILASMPTSKDHIPNNIEQKGGCIELPDINLNCFVITTEMCVTECGKYFPRQTYLYGQDLSDVNILEMEESYPLENTDFELWGKMDNALYLQLIACFLYSKSIKRKYKAILAL